MKLLLAVSALFFSFSSLGFVTAAQKKPNTPPNNFNNPTYEKLPPAIQDSMDTIDRYTSVVYENIKLNHKLNMNELNDFKNDIQNKVEIFENNLENGLSKLSKLDLIDNFQAKLEWQKSYFEEKFDKFDKISQEKDEKIQKLEEKVKKSDLKFLEMEEKMKLKDKFIIQQRQNFVKLLNSERETFKEELSSANEKASKLIETFDETASKVEKVIVEFESIKTNITDQMIAVIAADTSIVGRFDDFETKANKDLSDLAVVTDALVSETFTYKERKSLEKFSKFSKVELENPRFSDGKF